ncbi:MAG: DUF805 domain-containing protein [Spirochaetia bacterium]|uniref:DUF805 domain-containing protein n=1 Tax=Candidatus Avelusimicrobium fimicolum TaxID=3416216 RepID=UPI003C81333E|nr:DUF805 domain-containing protein [Spirochaetia bacterium]
MINKYFLDVFKNHYVDFKGRATRKQYWLYVLFTFIAFLILAAVVSFLGKTGNIIYTLCQLAILLPSLAILARRLHDTNKSAWWLLLNLVPFIGGLVLFVFALLPSNEGENRFGPANN